MIVNVSLGEKLRAAFGITLPDLPEGDDWLPNEYFDAVATVIAGEKRWEVDRTGIGLGFFTFSRFLMRPGYGCLARRRKTAPKWPPRQAARRGSC